MTRTLPNFIIVGTAKAGTTSVYRYLQQHPQIYMSPKKEPHYFAFPETDTPLHFSGPHDPRHWREMTVLTLTDYENLFAPASDEIALGETSTLYMYYKDSFKNMHQLIPDAKLIAILRDPADRAFSAYTHRRRDGREPCDNLEDAIAQEAERIAEGWAASAFYVSVGKYSEQLEEIYQYFSPEQVRVLIYDDFLQNPQMFMREIFEFLGVDPTVKIDMREWANSRGTIKNPVLRQLDIFFRFNSKYIEGIKRIIPEFFLKPLQGIYHETLNRAMVKESLSAAQRAWLIDIFREDIEKTSKIIDRDLSHWLK